jgi:hypothetical protein
MKNRWKLWLIFFNAAKQNYLDLSVVTKHFGEEIENLFKKNENLKRILES